MKTQPFSASGRTAQPAETIYVTNRRIGCDGGAAASQGALGHPLVYLTVGADGAVDCPYCGRHFVLAESAVDAHDH